MISGIGDRGRSAHPPRSKFLQICGGAALAALLFHSDRVLAAHDWPEVTVSRATITAGIRTVGLECDRFAAAVNRIVRIVPGDPQPCRFLTFLR